MGTQQAKHVVVEIDRIKRKAGQRIETRPTECRSHAEAVAAQAEEDAARDDAKRLRRKLREAKTALSDIRDGRGSQPAATAKLAEIMIDVLRLMQDAIQD